MSGQYDPQSYCETKNIVLHYRLSNVNKKKRLCREDYERLFLGGKPRKGQVLRTGEIISKETYNIISGEAEEIMSGETEGSGT